MYDVKVYNKAEEYHRQVTAHFQVHEFACEDGSNVVLVSQTLADIIENMRVHFGSPGHINSGYRTVSYNATLPNSSPKSKHCYGLAVDIWFEGHSPEEVYAYADKLLGNHGGVGLYDNFVHVDCRSDKSRWDYRS